MALSVASRCSGSIIAKLPTQAVINVIQPSSTLRQKRGFKQKAKGGGKNADAESISGRDKKTVEDINRFIELTEQAKKYKHPWTDEELAEHEAISKEFTRQSMIRNNQ